MRRRLLSQSGLDGIHDMVCYIYKNASQTPFNTIRVKFAAKPDDVSNSDVFIDKNVNNSGYQPSIVITPENLVDKLTTLGLKRSDDFYYGLFFTESDMGVIIASNTETTPLQYKKQSISDLFTSGATVNWYNQRVTMSAGSYTIPEDGGSISITLQYGYANYNYVSLSNTTDFIINKTTGGGSLTTTSFVVYTISAKGTNTSKTKKTTTFTISNGNNTLSDAIVDKSITITQTESSELGYFTVTLSQQDHIGKSNPDMGHNYLPTDMPEYYAEGIYDTFNQELYLHTDSRDIYTNNSCTFTIKEMYILSAVDGYTPHKYNFHTYTTNGGITITRSGVLGSSSANAEWAAKNSPWFLNGNNKYTYWKESGANKNDYYVMVNCLFGFQIDDYRYIYGNDDVPERGMFVKVVFDISPSGFASKENTNSFYLRYSKAHLEYVQQNN